MKLESLVEIVRSLDVGGHRVEQWQFHRTDGRRFSLGIKDREVGNAHAPLSLAEGQNTRYKLIWSDGRVCRGTLERQQEPRAAFRAARANAYDDPDAAHVLGARRFPEVELHDEATAAIAAGQVEPIARRLEAVRGEIERAGCKTWSGSFSAGASDSRMVNSAGLDVTSHGTSFGWFVNVNGEVGDGFSARRAESDDDFNSRLDALLQTAARIETDGKPLPAGVHPVLLHPRVVESYVLSTLLQNLDGSAVAHNEGAFELSSFGSNEPNLREDIDLEIDPLQPFKSGSYRFTGFGLPAARCTFIEAGRLVQPILDLKYATRLKLPPTPVPFGNDTIRFGSRQRLTYDEALTRTTVLVLSVLGVHTQDRISGDFSLSTPLALAVAAGAPSGRLRGTISGNLWEILRGDAVQFVDMPHETTPGMLFPCRFDWRSPDA